MRSKSIDLLEMQRWSHARSADNVAKTVRFFAGYDSEVTISALAGLLLLPSFQSSCLRLEMLVHAATSANSGNTYPRREKLAHWIKSAGSVIRHLEDPIEDTFASRVVFEGRNYRVLEGLSEAGTHHLQVILNILDDTPSHEPFISVRNQCRSMLVLSESACSRAEIEPFSIGPEIPISKMNIRTIPPVKTLVGWTTFSRSRLSTLSIDPKDLAEFVLPECDRDVISKFSGGSALECKPVIKFGETLVLALPTAVGTAIRTAVIKACQSQGGAVSQILRMKHLSEHANILSNSPLFSSVDLPRTALSLDPTISSEPVEIEPGYWLHLVLAVDDLSGFSDGHFMGNAQGWERESANLNAAILRAETACKAQTGFKAGLTYIVMCGYGRGQRLGLTGASEDWYIEAASTYDTDVLGWCSDFSISDLFRLSITERDLAEKGFEVRHMNGLLAQVGDAIANQGHMIPHEALPDGIPGGIIVAPSNSQLELRVRHHKRQDIQAVATPENGAAIVRRKDGGNRSPGGESRIYCSIEEVRQRRLRGVWLRSDMSWWAETRAIDSADTANLYGVWEAQTVWLERIGPVLCDCLDELPHMLEWQLRIDPQPPTYSDSIVPATIIEVLDDISVSCDLASKSVTTEVGSTFWRGLSNDDNSSEYALIKAFLTGIQELVKEAEFDVDELMERVVPSASARQLHAFAPQDFRDHMRDAFDGKVVHIGQFQDAAIRIGLGWHGVERPGGTIYGRDECKVALNKITQAAEEELCRELGQFELRSLLDSTIRNHEAAEVDKRRWQRTAGAMIALSDDELSLRSEIHDKTAKLNGVSLACRLLAEVGLHECKLRSGSNVADIDLSRLMSRALMIVHLGGYSDAIYFGAMTPELRISPAGEVQIDTSFFSQIMDPVGRDFANHVIEEKRASYSELLAEPEIHSVGDTGSIEPEFLAAWEDEMGAALSDFRLVIDEVENLTMESSQAWLTIPRDELISRLLKKSKAAEKVVEALENASRKEWRQVPNGFVDADRQPWRYRRRLSVARLPMLRLGSGASAEMVIAPGMVREGLGATLINMYEGCYDSARLQSKPMRKWASKVANQAGSDFEQQVAERLSSLGWQTETGVKFTKVLKGDLDFDPGDIDVLAWNADGRILLLECKQLQMAKTASEIAKQLHEFRGELNERGKPDRLAKHLARLDLATERAHSFAEYTQSQDISLQGLLVFSRSVPMQYAVDRMKRQIGVTTVADLYKI